MGVKYDNIRAISLAVINKGNKTLVCPGYDEVKKSHFYRLIGGGIEFGESSLEALRREIKEELNLELSKEMFLAVEENIFSYNGKKAHEICFYYKVDFANEKDYEKTEFQILDSSSHKAIWLEINEDNLSKIKPGKDLSIFRELLNKTNEGNIK